MKTLNITIKIITVFLLAGALFFSCTLADPDANGTLIIALPGSGARAATFDEYITTLSYRVICHNALNETGEADEIISKPVSYNKKTSISLAPGAWYVTVEVLDTEKPEGEQVVGEGTTELPVIIESGKTTTAPKITIKIDYDGKEEPIEIKWEWPVKTTWAKYGLSSGLTQPRPTETTVAYVFKNGDTLSDEANGDLGLLPKEMKQPEKGKEFLLVKLEGVIDNDYLTSSQNGGLYYEISIRNGIEKINQAPSLTTIRWDIFKNSNTVVNLYMNRGVEKYIIILVVKEDTWNEVPWEEYGLGGLEQPVGTEVVRVIQGDPNTRSADTDTIKAIVDLSTFSIGTGNTRYDNHFIVILRNMGNYNEAGLRQKIEEIPNYFATANNSGEYRARKDDSNNNKTYVISLQLVKEETYIVIFVREGKLNWYD